MPIKYHAVSIIKTVVSQVLLGTRLGFAHLRSDPVLASRGGSFFTSHTPQAPCWKEENRYTPFHFFLHLPLYKPCNASTPYVCERVPALALPV